MSHATSVEFENGAENNEVTLKTPMTSTRPGHVTINEGFLHTFTKTAHVPPSTPVAINLKTAELPLSKSQTSIQKTGNKYPVCASPDLPLSHSHVFQSNKQQSLVRTNAPHIMKNEATLRHFASSPIQDMSQSMEIQQKSTLVGAKTNCIPKSTPILNIKQTTGPFHSKPDVEARKQNVNFRQTKTEVSPGKSKMQSPTKVNIIPPKAFSFDTKITPQPQILSSKPIKAPNKPSNYKSNQFPIETAPGSNKRPIFERTGTIYYADNNQPDFCSNQNFAPSSNARGGKSGLVASMQQKFNGM